MDLRVVDDKNSHFRFLVTTTSHPNGFAQSQVLPGFNILTMRKRFTCIINVTSSLRLLIS